MSEPDPLRAALEHELRDRGYDDYPADESLFEELLDDLTATARRVVLEPVDESRKRCPRCGTPGSEPNRTGTRAWTTDVCAVCSNAPGVEEEADRG